MKSIRIKDTELFYKELGEDNNDLMIWGHGWGQSHTSFIPLAEPLSHDHKHVIIDFPGFGSSPVPPDVWGTQDYADAMAEFIRTKTDKKIIWVGHSFGCRVGLQLAAHHPDLIKGLCLIAGAGLHRKRPLWQKLYFKSRIYTFKALKKLIPLGLPEKWLMKTFASADYQSAGPLRSIFVKVVNEDLSDIAHTITCPVLLIYGEKDTETPPEIGQRLEKIIPNASYIELEGFDHYTILLEGRHQVVRLLKNFMNDIKQKDIS